MKPRSTSTRRWGFETMDIWNVDKLTLFLVFFLPGFISIKVYDLMVPGERRDFSKSLLEVISYSTLNFGALFWLIVPIQRGDFSRSHFVLYSLAVTLIMVIVPACWPVVFLKLSTWRRVARYFVHPIGKPWDYVFGKRCPFWIIVHLQNGQKLADASIQNLSPPPTRRRSRFIYRKSGFWTKQGVSSARLNGHGG